MKKLLTIAIVLSFILVNSVSTPYAIQTESKISAEVCEAIEGIDDDDELSVYVIISDIDYDEVMNKFEESFPEQYNEYYLATECDVASEIRQVVQGGVDEKENYIEYDDPIDGNLLQQAIETKRALSAEAYQARNQAFADSLVCKEKQEFVSKYSPMLILTLTKSQILALEDNDDVCRVELLINFKLEEELAVANSISRADYVRDTNGNKGAGVKIGQIDAGVPDITNSDLQNASITRHSTSVSSHATAVARILVGSSNGLAPSAQLYSTSYSDYYAQAFYENVEWLVSKGVNVINMSAYVYAYNGENWDGKYNIVPQWLDHIAAQHDIHFVKSSGNNSGLITCPGMAYNIITVGGFNDSDTVSHADDSRYSASSYTEYASTNRAEKPNLIASAVNINIGGTNSSGTSLSAPQVTGVIAQLCSYQSALKTKQTVVGAMLSVGAKYKLEGSSGSGAYPDTFSPSIRVSGSTQISKFEGAGKLDARCPRSVASSGNYWSPTINTSGFPYTQSVYISTSSNSNVRVSIFWLKRNSISTSSHTPGTVSQTTFTDLDLYVYAPNGSLVGSSTTSYSNYEIVQFQPSQTGTYTIKITRNGSSTSTKEHVGIAVW